jgi:hypothetical protein
LNNSLLGGSKHPWKKMCVIHRVGYYLLFSQSNFFPCFEWEKVKNYFAPRIARKCKHFTRAQPFLACEATPATIRLTKTICIELPAFVTPRAIWLWLRHNLNGRGQFTNVVCWWLMMNVILQNSYCYVIAWRRRLGARWNKESGYLLAIAVNHEDLWLDKNVYSWWTLWNQQLFCLSEAMNKPVQHLSARARLDFQRSVLHLFSKGFSEILSCGGVLHFRNREHLWEVARRNFSVLLLLTPPSSLFAACS